MSKKSVLEGHLRLSSSTLEAAAVPEPAKPGAPSAAATGEAPKKEEKMYSADELLRIWGLRITGKDFTNPDIGAQGGERSTSEEAAQIVDYIETTPGFGTAAPVLYHRYVQFKDVERFDPRRPGETFLFALGRLGWTKHQFTHPRDLGPKVFQRFMANLLRKMDETPFRFVWISQCEESGPVTESEKDQLERIHGKKAKKR